MAAKFPNGPRTLNYGTNLDWHVVADDTGLDTPIGRFAWTDPPGWYRKSDDLKIQRLSDDIHYVAICGAENFGGEWH